MTIQQVFCSCSGNSYTELIGSDCPHSILRCQSTCYKSEEKYKLNVIKLTYIEKYNKIGEEHHSEVNKAEKTRSVAPIIMKSALPTKPDRPDYLHPSTSL